MIAAWAVYATLFTLLLALAARAAEETLGAWGLPTRWAWTAAAAGSVAVPAALRWDLAGRALRRAGELLSAGGGGRAAGSAALEAPGLGAGPAPASTAAWPDLLQLPPVADRTVLALWILGSALVLGGALRAWWRIRRGLREWPSVRVEGTEVRVSADVGPAVSGVLDPVIVVPRRILELPPSERRLVIRHELEHREARDTTLLAVGLAALAACPWNPALWWTVRRLRLAVERDCDRRVVDAGADPAAYGSVLLAEAGGRAGSLPAAAFGRGAGHLERRIRSLTAGPPRFRALRSAAAALAAAGLVFAACDAPTPPKPGADGAVSSVVADTVTSRSEVPGWAPPQTRLFPRDVEPRPTNGDEIVRLLRRRYPPGLKESGIGGTVGLRLYVNREGVVEKGRIEASSGHGALDRAALEVAKQMEFRPALSGNRPIGVWVSRDVTFRPGPSDGGRLLRVRGGATLELSEGPVLIVDGERLEDRSALDDLDPEEIESIEVIKGPAAEALYGAEAADGVIRITTKSGG